MTNATAGNPTSASTSRSQGAQAQPSRSKPSSMGANQDLRWVWLASEVLLVATSIATIFMLQRIFLDTSFVAPLIFTVLVAHAVLISMRWFGFGTATSALVSALATVIAIVAIHYSQTAITAIIPTGATIDQFRLDMTQAQDLFQTLKSPVPPVTGFIVFSSIGFWLVAFAADWAAFRIFAPGQALIPFVGMLVFVSLLGIDQDRLSTTATALICGVLFLLAHRAAASASHGVWLDHGPGRGYIAMMAAGGVVAVIAAAIGVMGGPAVPGADAAPLVEIGDETREENKPLEVISPLVQIQPRLVDQSDQVLFTVETNQPAYWRIAALDVFDGALWRSQGQFRSADDELPVGYPSSAPTNLVRQTFDLGELNVVWAPAAYLPTGFDNESGIGVNYESESATFIVDTKEQDVSDGLRYTVTSQIPAFTGPMLTQLAADNAGQTVDARYLELPNDYSPLARQTALDIIGTETDPYTQALLLQNYFQENFIYDLDVAKGHDIRRLEDFLTVQRGYCEQFAGTYASMARAIGLPARVATGFTKGDVDPSNPNLYIVRGKHAHAWPEVFIAGAGWVPFEPTPGRGAPNSADYTGLPEAQDSFEAPAPEAQEAEAVPQPPSPDDEPVPPTPTPIPEIEEQLAAEELAAEELAAEELASGPPSNAVRNILIALAAIAAWVFGVPALKSWRERRRVARIGTDPRRRTTLAWAAAVDVLERHNQEPFANESLEEYAHRVERETPASHPAFGQLTALAVAAAYRSTPPSEAEAENAEALAKSVRESLDASQSWTERNARIIDPRPLIKLSDPVADLATRLAEGATEEASVPS